MTDNRCGSVVLSVIAHGLRSPTSVISGYARMLREGRLSGDARDRALAGIAKAADEIDAIATRTSDLANWSTRAETPSPSTLPIRQQLQLAVAACADPARVDLALSPDMEPAPDPDARSLSVDDRALTVSLAALIDVVAARVSESVRVSVAAKAVPDHSGWEVVVGPAGPPLNAHPAPVERDVVNAWRVGGLPLLVAVATLETHGGGLRSITDADRCLVVHLAAPPGRSGHATGEEG